MTPRAMSAQELVTLIVCALKTVDAKTYVEIVGVHDEERGLLFSVMSLSGEAPSSRAARYEKIVRGMQRRMADLERQLKSR